LRIEISQAAVSKYLGRRSTPPSQRWRTFFDNHIRSLVSVDFFTVPTVTFKVLFVFVVLAHDRRRVVHFNVTDAPTAHWTARQLAEAFPWETAPRYLLRDRDAVYGVVFSSRAQSLGIREVKTAPRSPRQNPYVERLIGTLRRECLLLAHEEWSTSASPPARSWRRLELIHGPHDGETVAVVLADSGLKYLSTDLWPAVDGERPEVTG
jgi:hypothetical protein